MVAIYIFMLYTNSCCDIDSVETRGCYSNVGFPRSECQVRKLATSHCTKNKSTIEVETRG